MNAQMSDLAALLQQTIELRDRFAERAPLSCRYSILCRDVVRLRALLADGATKNAALLELGHNPLEHA